MKEIIKMRDTFREAADILDEFIALKVKEDNGEDITKETESILGRFVLKTMELQQMQNKI